MSIIRSALPSDEYTRIRNSWARDPRLRLADKGLLLFLASHAVGYELTTEQIIAQSADGRDAVLGAVRRLEEAGYLRRIRRRNQDGTLGSYDYELCEPDPQSGMSHGGKTRTGRDQQEQDVSAGGNQCGKNHRGKSSDKEDHPLEEQEEDIPSPTGSAQPVDEPENAGDLVAAWVDYCAGQQIRLPRQVIARYGREIKDLLGQGFSPKLIKNTLAGMLHDGKASHPALLGQRIIEAQQTQPTSGPPRGQYRSAAERREDANYRARLVAEVSDRMAAEQGVKPSDVVTSMQIRSQAEKIVDSMMHTRSGSGHDVIAGTLVPTPPRFREVTAGEPR